MTNSRITAKELGMLKGAVRRVFSRSELHERALAKNRVPHEDPKHPKCKKWVWCATCGLVFPQWLSAVDHIVPVIPVDKVTTDMSLDEIADRAWCDESLLQVLCKPCHNAKSKAENAERKLFRKARKQNERT